MYTLQFSWLWPNLPALLNGALVTVMLTVTSCLAGSLIGIVVGLSRHEGNRLLRAVGGTYVEAIRNTPLLAQAFLIYFGLASLGFRLSPMAAATVALIVNCGAYSAEIFRAGFSSIKLAQREAAESLALTRTQSFLYVILPQALRNIWVPLSGQFVLIMLASSVVSQISAEELTSVASQLQSLTFRSFEVYIVLAVIYFVLSGLLKIALGYLGVALFHTGKRKPAVAPALQAGG
jgi:polar amino acid transport system permease protein